MRDPWGEAAKAPVGGHSAVAMRRDTMVAIPRSGQYRLSAPDEPHLSAILADCVAYYNRERPNRTVGVQMPEPRVRPTSGPIHAQACTGAPRRLIQAEVLPANNPTRFFKSAKIVAAALNAAGLLDNKHRSAIAACQIRIYRHRGRPPKKVDRLPAKREPDRQVPSTRCTSTKVQGNEAGALTVPDTRISSRGTCP